MKHRIDRFINLMELQFDIEDTKLMEELHTLLKKGHVEFKDFLRPYIESALKDPDLITRAIILHNHLVVRLGYKNGNWVKAGYTLVDLRMVVEDFEGIVRSLRREISELEKEEDKEL